jgi:hypothetical protein
VCLAYAKQVARGAELTPASPDEIDSMLAMNRPRFRDLSWFDLPGASDLVGAHAGVFVWVDRARGVSTSSMVSDTTCAMRRDCCWCVASAALSEINRCGSTEDAREQDPRKKTRKRLTSIAPAV